MPQSIQDQKEDLVLENINSIFTKNSILKKEKKKWTCCYIMIWVLAVIFKVNPAKLRKSKKKNILRKWKTYMYFLLKKLRKCNARPFTTQCFFYRIIYLSVNRNTTGVTNGTETFPGHIFSSFRATKSLVFYVVFPIILCLFILIRYNCIA